jgi:hypothetical protein
MKQIIFLIFSVLLFFNTITIAQSITWQRTYDRGININDIGYDVCKSNGNNFFIACTSNDSICVIKINFNGEIIFTRMINPGLCLAIVSSGDDGCVITGKRHFAFTSNIDSIGNILWFRDYTHVDANYIQCFNIIKTNDDGYLFSGYVQGYVNYFGFCTKINYKGEHQWASGMYDSLKIKCTLRDNNDFIFAGPRKNSGIVIKTDSTNNFLWIKEFKINSMNTSINNIINAKLYYAIAAETFYQIQHKVYFVKFNLTGDTDFVKSISSIYSEYSPKVYRINENKYVFVSNKDTIDSNPGFAIIRLIDSNGNIIREKFYKWINTLELFSMVQTSDNGFLFVGWNKDSRNGKSNIYALKTDSLLDADPPIGINNNNEKIPETFILHQNYPNPFNPATNIKFEIPSATYIKLTIYDITGREIVNINEYRQAGFYTYTFDGNNLASGVYIYKLIVGDNTNNGVYTETRKMVLLK